MMKWIEKNWLDIMAAIMFVSVMIVIGNWGRG